MSFDFYQMFLPNNRRGSSMARKKSEKEKADNSNLPTVITANNQKLMADEMQSEVNSLIFPIFLLSKKNSKDQKVIEYQDTINRDNERLDIHWKVSTTAEFDLPTTFDKKVFKAIEYIINERGWPVKNPIPFSLTQICKILNINDSGENTNNIKKALKRITMATIESKAAFYRKAIKKNLDDIFRLYDRIVFINKTMPDNTIADTNYLFLGSFYIESLNAYYIKKIDFQFYKELGCDIACRLYEILGIKFFGTKKGFIYFNYQQLCALLPIAPQKYLSNAQKCLKSAHEELIKKEFLTKVEWETENKDWIVKYYPGKKAIEEQNVKLEEDKKVLSLEHQEVKETAPEANQNLITELIKRGITKSGAVKAIASYQKQFPNDNLQDVLECYDYKLQNNQLDKIINKPAILLKFIANNENQISGFQTTSQKEAQQQEQRIKKQQEKEKEKLQDAYKQYRHQQFDDYIAQLPAETYQAELEKIREMASKEHPLIKNKEGVGFKHIVESHFHDHLIEQGKINILSFENWNQNRSHDLQESI